VGELKKIWVGGKKAWGGIEVKSSDSICPGGMRKGNPVMIQVNS